MTVASRAATAPGLPGPPAPGARRPRGGRRWRALLLVGLACTACAGAPAERGEVRRIAIVAFSDWHGQLEPLVAGEGGARRPLGGAAALKAYFDRERARNPGRTLVVTAGDAFGATPPLSSFLEDVPAVEALNALGLDADTLGNHNFDHGLERLQKLMGLARYRHLAANIVAPDGATLAPPTHVFPLDGVRVGVIGVGNPDTPSLVAPGRTGPWRFLEPAPVVTAHARRLRAEGAEVVVVLAHVGAVTVERDGAPAGPLGDLARAVEGVDVLIGDHTDATVNARVGDLLVVESRSRGAEYAVIEVDYAPARRAVVAKRAHHRRPWADAVEPDPALRALVEGYRVQMRPHFDRPVGAVARRLTRSRERESLLGNFVTDALRAAYGTQVAFDVSGGLRDDLPSSYQPGGRGLRRPTAGYAAGPPWDVVQGDLLAVLPFHNVAVTLALPGRVLWEVLEHSVGAGTVRAGRFVNASGRFLQVSGLTFAFDPRRPRGRRVLEVQLADGRPVRPDDTRYTAVTSEFVFNGGDGYTMLRPLGGVTRDLIADAVARALAGRPPIEARLEGRIVERTE